jgi:porin
MSDKSIRGEPSAVQSSIAKGAENDLEPRSYGRRRWSGSSHGATPSRKIFLGNVVDLRGMALSLGASLAILSVGIVDAFGQTVCPSQPSQTPDGASQAAPTLADLFAPSRTNLLGGIGGLRPALENYGLTLSLFDTNELFGNASGGIKQGANYGGLTQMCLVLDTKKAFGLDGGTVNVSAFQIRGRDLSAANLLNLQIYSGIAALPATRLWEIWYQQTFLGGKMDVKVGQQSLDQEFMTSQGSSLFVNAMMGWPMLPTADMYGGGPAYPLSSAGVRLRAQPSESVTLLAGVFQDNPPGGPFNDDPQNLGSSAWGGNFLHLGSTGVLFITEGQYSANQSGNHGLPGTYKLGAWFDTASFPSPEFDTAGFSLAAPNSTGVPQMEQGNFSVYGVADQMIWRGADGQQALSLFIRPMGAPSDRNLISFSVNGGATLKAPFTDRANDTLGVGFGMAQVSNYISTLDEERSFFAGQSLPVRSTETFIEVTYQCQVAGWWQLQPDFQYFIRPGAGILDPNNPTSRVGDEAVFGLRSVVTF